MPINELFGSMTPKPDGFRALGVETPIQT